MSTVERTVAHALITWRDGTVLRTAFRGQTVRLPTDAAARLEQFGAFTADTPSGDTTTDSLRSQEEAGPDLFRGAGKKSDTPDPETGTPPTGHDVDVDSLADEEMVRDPAESAAAVDGSRGREAFVSAVGLPDRPVHVATKEVWVDYAEELHARTGGRYGFARSEADEMNKRELIAALTDQLPPDDDTEER